MNLFKLIKQNCGNKKRFSEPALICGQKRLTYKELFIKVEALSLYLKQAGCKREERIAVNLEDGPLLIMMLLACAQTGMVFIGINQKLPEREIDSLMAKANPKLVAGEAMPVPGRKVNCLVRSEIEEFLRAPSDKLKLRVKSSSGKGNFTVTFSSGSTGIPKGIFHHQADYAFVAQRCIETWGLSSSDVFLSGLPLLSAATLGCIIFPALLAGACLVVASDRGADGLLQAIEEHKATFLLGSPTNYVQILNRLESSNINLKSLRHGTIAGSRIPAGLIEKMKEKIGAIIYPHYGMTELLAVSSVEDRGDFHTVGKPFKGIKAKIVNGEIYVLTPARIKGYADGSSIELAGGWFKTGDLGAIDVNGNLQVLGRKDGVINRGGNNIYPEEIESKLLAYSGIHACAVAAVPDGVYGERIAAYIVAGRQFNKNEMRSYLFKSLPAYKLPDEIRFVQKLPLSPAGKVDRKILRSML